MYGDCKSHNALNLKEITFTLPSVLNAERFWFYTRVSITDSVKAEKKVSLQHISQ